MSETGGGMKRMIVYLLPSRTNPAALPHRKSDQLHVRIDRSLLLGKLWPELRHRMKDDDVCLEIPSQMLPQDLISDGIIPLYARVNHDRFKDDFRSAEEERVEIALGSRSISRCADCSAVFDSETVSDNVSYQLLDALGRLWRR